MTEPNFNAAWARTVVGAIADAGVRHFIIAPGSRSSPLVRAAVQHPKIDCTLWIDERGAAFFAVGIARASGVPAAVITTSGTAVANLLPACVEAFQDDVPLILLTADRPDELVVAGANQAIDQTNLFTDYVHAAADMQPDARIPASDVRAAIHLALHGAFGLGPNGPVHLNLRFDEPLAPSESEYDTSWLDDATPEPFQASAPAPVDIDATMLARMRDAPDGILVATAPVGAAGIALAHALGWPLYPDVRSDLRLAQTDDLVWCHAAGLLAQGAWSPKVLVLLGPHPTDRQFLQWAHAASFDQILVVDEHDQRRDGFRLPESMVWTDVAEADFEVGPWSQGPQSGALIRTSADPKRWAAAAAAALTDLTNTGSTHTDSTKTDATHTNAVPTEDAGTRPDLSTLRTAHARLMQDAEDALHMRDLPGLTGAVMARHISRAIRPDGALMLSNSMPVRDFGRFAAVDGPAVPVHVNRGASGIDGILSTAAGVARAHGAATVFIGDQAFLHDLSALPNIARAQPALTIVLHNNGGGEIFKRLPIAQHPDVYSPWFDARHNHLLGSICENFGIAYTTVDTRAEFAEAFASSQRSDGPSVIEAITAPLSARLGREPK